MPQKSIFLLSIDQISNTDDLLKKSEQILPYQLVFTCCLGVFFTCKYEVLFDLIKKHIVIVDSPWDVNNTTEHKILGQ